VATPPDPPSTGTAQRPHRWSFPIGRVSGIEIRVHATFFLLVALFVAVSGQPGALGLVDSLVWLVLIFSCVLVHELAHCLVGRRRGAVVHEIVLLPIGGVSRLEKLPESPADELAMAIAGPGASLGLAAAAAVVSLAWRGSVLPVNIYDGALLTRLLWFNLIIAGFNLLPAFPLDGGRVLRALLEERYDLERATRLAARVGRVLALALIAVGVLVNLWFAIIGVFVYFGASAEESATIIHVRLAGRRVADVMLLDPAVVEPATDVAVLRELVRHTAQPLLPVVGPDGFVGSVDPATLALAGTGSPAGDLVERDPHVVAPGDELEDATLHQVVRAHAKAVAVVDRGRVVGLLRLEDVQHLLDAPSPGDAARPG
jgi:Zn-dependent protease